MSNLIITIISIALVAVLAIAGIFYGGAAYQNAQAKAYAVAIADQATQVNNAIVQWSSDHGGASFLAAVGQTGYCCGNNPSSFPYSSGSPGNLISLLVPNYLQSMSSPAPNDFAGVQRSGAAVPQRWEISGSDYDPYLLPNVWPNAYATYGYFIWLKAVQPVTSQAIQICNEIAIIARGANAAPIYAHINNDQSPYVGGKGQNPILDCSWSAFFSTGYSTINQCVGTSGSCTIYISAQINASF